MARPTTTTPSPPPEITPTPVKRSPPPPLALSLHDSFIPITPPSDPPFDKVAVPATAQLQLSPMITGPQTIKAHQARHRRPPRILNTIHSLSTLSSYLPQKFDPNFVLPEVLEAVGGGIELGWGYFNDDEFFGGAIGGGMSVFDDNYEPTTAKAITTTNVQKTIRYLLTLVSTFDVLFEKIIRSRSERERLSDDNLGRDPPAVLRYIQGVEFIKAILRLVLIVCSQQNIGDSSTDELGILLTGGELHGSNGEGLSSVKLNRLRRVENRRLLQKETAVGRRKGKLYASSSPSLRKSTRFDRSNDNNDNSSDNANNSSNGNSNNNTSNNENDNTKNNANNITNDNAEHPPPQPPIQKKHLAYIGEFLHVLRPVVVTHIRRKLQGKNEWLPWLIGLGMDVGSDRASRIGLGFLNEEGQEQGLVTAPSRATTEELKRRKLRWMLYLLRSPIWAMISKKVVRGITGVAEKVPLIGGFAEYVREMLEYVRKYHFMLESC